MKVTIMVTDLIFRFRLGAICPDMKPIQMWQMEVMTMADVAHVLHALGLLDPDEAWKLADASTTIVPLEGFNTVPIMEMANIIEIVHPEIADVNEEAKAGYMMVVEGETTEEELAAAGFVAQSDGPVQ